MKIAIIGKLPSKFYAPFDNPDWEIWGCNVHTDMDKIPRFDLWFDIHKKPSIYNNIALKKLIFKDLYPLKEVHTLLVSI